MKHGGTPLGIPGRIVATVMQSESAIICQKGVALLNSATTDCSESDYALHSNELIARLVDTDNFKLMDWSTVRERRL